MHFTDLTSPKINTIKISLNMNHQQGPPATLPCLDSISHILNPDRGKLLKWKQAVNLKLDRH